MKMDIRTIELLKSNISELIKLLPKNIIYTSYTNKKFKLSELLDIENIAELSNIAIDIFSKISIEKINENTISFFTDIVSQKMDCITKDPIDKNCVELIYGIKEDELKQWRSRTDKLSIDCIKNSPTAKNSKCKYRHSDIQKVIEFNYGEKIDFEEMFKRIIDVYKQLHQK